MAANIFKGDRKKESVAYDLALALAAKDPAANTPGALIDRIAELLPECREVVDKKYSDEIPPPAGILL
ncbi:hypothetical protein [Pantoea eucrina]|uniref:hypothetical protein n=1 Tax=Pantoea eucrina TaxID=472693 RepID=UPI000D47F102|nr:hypothetical protein [Pantoea eucrina]PPS58846.1 hypothetical protein CRX72_23920 [Pantoea sp. BRM17]UBB12389.1 hypothetical protein LAC65_11185 [Pantoea eucrina]